MHEYSIAKELITTLTEQVDEEKLIRVEEVHLELGELKFVSEEALSQAFEIITEDTILSGANLEFEEVSLVVRCRECGFEGGVDYEDGISLHFSIPVLSCPKCGGSTDIVKGDELSVKSLSLKDPDEY